MENQRIRLSRQLLKEALIDLLQEKPIEKITIKEICEKAGINRSTFYRHYSSEYDLLGEIEQDGMDILREALKNQDSGSLETILVSLKENPKLARVLFGSGKDSSRLEKIFSLPEIKDYMQENLHLDIQSSPGKDVYFFICQGGFGYIVKWI